MKTYNWLHYKENLPSKIHGIGIFAKCFIPKGSIIKTPSLGFHVYGDSGGVNHSCEPTIRPINPNFDMLALKDIQRGEELTNDYWGPNKLGCNCPKCCSAKRY